MNVHVFSVFVRENLPLFPSANFSVDIGTTPRKEPGLVAYCACHSRPVSVSSNSDVYRLSVLCRTKRACEGAVASACTGGGEAKRAGQSALRSDTSPAKRKVPQAHQGREAAADLDSGNPCRVG